MRKAGEGDHNPPSNSLLIRGAKMIKQLEVLMYEERLKELHVCKLAVELRGMCMCGGVDPDSCLQIIESISSTEGEGLWRWPLGDYLRAMNELKKRGKKMASSGGLS